MGIVDYIHNSPRIGEYDLFGVKPVHSTFSVQDDNTKKTNKQDKSKARRLDRDEYIHQSEPGVDLYLYDNKGKSKEIFAPTEEIVFPSGGGSFQEILREALKRG